MRMKIVFAWRHFFFYFYFYLGHGMCEEYCNGICLAQFFLQGVAVLGHNFLLECYKETYCSDMA